MKVAKSAVIDKMLDIAIVSKSKCLLRDIYSGYIYNAIIDKSADSRFYFYPLSALRSIIASICNFIVICSYFAIWLTAVLLDDTA